jgi:histidinol-phosphate aminotransferase
VTEEYQRPVVAAGTLRLHLNENTAGCSPRVVEALRALTPEEVAFYPDYEDAYRAAASFLGVGRRQLLLVNGLDEGILIAAVLALKNAPADGAAEAIVVQPAFDMYGISARACGVDVVDVPPNTDFTFPVERTVAAVTPRTRLVYLTSPNNPTGIRISNADVAAVAAALPPGALILLDEAYHDFCGETFVTDLAGSPNVIVGRTFAKAHGLAALRVGALVGSEAALAPFRVIAPPYSLNVCAATALPAALGDREHFDWYLDQVRASRERLYAFCRRLGLDYWESGANFVLVRVGGRASRLVADLASRGIQIRNKTGDPGCDGCIRITTGVTAHTERAIAAMEAFLASSDD